MENAAFMLANIWFGILALMLFLYVVLDGFDLGVGILSLFVSDEDRRGLMMTSLSGTWDANETWLVLLGGGLFGAMPLVYSILSHAFYIPFLLLLIGLAFRAVAFEFRRHSIGKRVWDLSFGLGSFVAAISQGLILGGVLQGISISDGAFSGGPWDWIGYFSIIVAVGVVAGYMLLGASYLSLKTEGPLQDWSFKQARMAGWLTFAMGALVTILTPFVFPGVTKKWFAVPDLFYYGSLPALAIFSFYKMITALKKRREAAPFAWSIALFTFSFIGLLATLHPYALPPSLTIYEASADPHALVFMLAGIGLLVPVIIAYNAYQYRIFKGKVRGDEYS